MKKIKNPKKIRTPLIIVCILVLVPLALFFYLWVFALLTPDVHKDKGEIEDLYKENQYLFEQIAEELSQYPDHVSIDTETTMFLFGPIARPDLKWHLGWGYQIHEFRDEPLTRKQIKRIKSLPIWAIHKNADVFHINIHDGCVWFTQSLATGTAYVIDKDAREPDENPFSYIVEWEEIAPHWYYFQTD